MPIYAYRCETCGHAQDVLQKLSDPLLTVCPACGATTYKKQVTAAGFQLKGSGWYVTDFRGDSNAQATKGGDSTSADAPKSDGKEGSKEGKSDAPADKSAGAAPAAKSEAAKSEAAPAPAAPSPGGTGSPPSSS
jgi:putative FmdB family regulatory protein